MFLDFLFLFKFLKCVFLNINILFDFRFLIVVFKVLFLVLGINIIGLLINFDNLVVIGFSEFVVLFLVVLICFKCENNINLVFFLIVYLIVGKVVVICVLFEIDLFLFKGILKFMCINIFLFFNLMFLIVFLVILFFFMLNVFLCYIIL